MCLLCTFLPAQKNTKSRGSAQFMVFAKAGPSGMQWGKVSREADSGSICIPAQHPSLLLIWLEARLPDPCSHGRDREGSGLSLAI